MLLKLIILQRKVQEDEEDDDEDCPKEFKLPQALEKVLAFKDVRAQQVGVKPEDMEKLEKGKKCCMAVTGCRRFP